MCYYKWYVGKHLRNKALNILESIGITNPEENILYGSLVMDLLAKFCP